MSIESNSFLPELLRALFSSVRAYGNDLDSFIFSLQKNILVCVDPLRIIILCWLLVDTFQLQYYYAKMSNQKNMLALDIQYIIFFREKSSNITLLNTLGVALFRWIDPTAFR